MSQTKQIKDNLLDEIEILKKTNIIYYDKLAELQEENKLYLDYIIKLIIEDNIIIDNIKIIELIKLKRNI